MSFLFHCVVKVIQYPQCAVHLMQHCWAQEPSDRPTAAQILQIVESEDFVRLLDVLQLLPGMEITACCLISADLLRGIKGTKDSDDFDDGHSESSISDPEESSTSQGKMKTTDRPVFSNIHSCSTSTEDSEVNDADINSDIDEVWLCEHRVGMSNDTNLDITEYFRGEDSTFDETRDTVVHDVVCSMLVVGDYVVMATSNNPRILVYGIANRSLCKHIALPLHLTEHTGVRQMIYVDDHLFLALHHGSIIRLPANDVVAPIPECDPMSMARVCHGQAEDLFCVVSVEKGNKSATSVPATGVEIWCGLASGHIAIIDAGSMEQLAEVNVELDDMSISEFVVNTVAFLAVTYSREGQQTVWASVQPGTFVYGFLAETREQVAAINCLPHLAGTLFL